MTRRWDDPFVFGAACVAGAVVLLGLKLVLPQTVVGDIAFSILLAALVIGLALFGWNRLVQARDVSAGLEKRSAFLEVELQRQRDALDDLADGLDVLVFLVDREGTVLYANDKAVLTFDVEPAGKQILAVTLSRELQSLVKSAVETERTVRGEIHFSHPVERTGIAQVWPERGSDERYFVSIYDITDLRRLERIRRDFVANVSHELRTPMTTIRAMAETIQDEAAQSSGTTHRYLERIISEVDRLTLITDDLLALSVAESKPAPRDPVDLSELVDGVVAQLEAKATERGLRLAADLATGIHVRGSGPQLAQIAINLVDNAINYTPHGWVEVRLALQGGEAVLEVEDTGVGIASEHQGRIFERFYRVDKARSRATGGTGLGLSIVRHLVEAHGGRVSVQSELNRGTTFTVRLPLA